MYRSYGGGSSIGRFLVLILFSFLLFAGGLWQWSLGLIGFYLLYKFFVWAFNDEVEGSFEERREDPNLSTNDWEQHQERLDKFSKSTYKNTTFYVGPKGGVYYITDRGTKVYC